jgi:RecA-family ATPase
MPSAEAIQIAKRAAAEMAIVEVFRAELEEPPVDNTPMPTSLADYGLSEDADAVVERAAGTVEVPLALITPPDWCGIPIPAMRWLATYRIPAGDVTILSGDGGGGKTTTALQLAVSVADNLGDWLGTTCEAGPVIFFSAEEPENEMRRRLARVAKKRGLDPDGIENLHFHFAEPDKCTLGAGKPNSPMAPTPLFESLRAAAKVIRPALIVVDSNAATLGGNYLDRVHARTFVSLFRQLAREVDCAVLLLDHPSLSGMTNGTGRAGNMDWQNSVRALLYLRSVESDQGATSGRELEVMKSNYGPRGEKQKLRWEDGCYVIESSATSPRIAAAERKIDELFIRLLAERNAQGRWVTPVKAVGYAPKELAAMPTAEGCTPAALANAMERLLAAKEISVETFGPPSKQRQRLVATPSNRLPTGN